MSKATNVNQLGGKVQVLVVSDEQQIGLTDHDDGGATEVTSAMDITKIIASGAVSILRGANTVWECTGDTNIDFAGAGASLKVDNTASCNVQCSAGESCLIEFKKIGTYDPQGY